MGSNYEADELLHDIVDSGYIEEGAKELGITRQCNDRGYDSLSPAQKAIYDHNVRKRLSSPVWTA